MKLRGGMAELRIKMGRWSGLSRDERICKNCESEVEDGVHTINAVKTALCVCG